MKATALGDTILLESENASDMATIRLVTKTHRVRLLNAGSESGPNGWTKETFLIGPDLTEPKARDTRLAEELEFANKRVGSLEHILDAIPPCPAHGKGCIPHALDWIKQQVDDAQGTE